MIEKLLRIKPNLHYLLYSKEMYPLWIATGILTLLWILVLTPYTDPKADAL